MAAVYGAGAAMGFTPQQVNQMSFWQFFAAHDGWVAANSRSEASLSETEALDLFDWIERDTPPDRQFTTQTYVLEGRHLVAQRIVTFTVPRS